MAVQQSLSLKRERLLLIEEETIMWEDFFSKVKIKKGRGTPVCLANDKLLDETEKAINIKLPASYRSFAKQIGPGEISPFFRIFAPNEGSKRWNLVDFVQSRTQLLAMAVDEFGDSPMLKDLLPFAETDMGDDFGWDTRERRADGEHPIYFYDHEYGEVHWIAESFPEFVDEVCLGIRLEGFITSEGYKALHTFSPAQCDRKRK